MCRHLQTPSFCLRSFLTIYPAPSPKILRHVLTPPPNFAQKQEKFGKNKKILEKIPSISLSLDEILKLLQENFEKHDVKNYVDTWNIPPSLL